MGCRRSNPPNRTRYSNAITLMEHYIMTQERLAKFPAALPRFEGMPHCVRVFVFMQLEQSQNKLAVSKISTWK